MASKSLVVLLSLAVFCWNCVVAEIGNGCSIQRITGPTYKPLRAFLNSSFGNTTQMDSFYNELNRTIYIRGSRDARIGMISLAGSTEEEFEMMYEIALGAGNNTYSSIRRGRPGSMLDKNYTRTIGLLDNNEWKGFWIYHNQNEGVIQVATLEDTEYPIMGFLDPKPLRVGGVWQIASWLKNMSLEVSVQCDPSIYGEVFVEELTSNSPVMAAISFWWLIPLSQD